MAGIHFLFEDFKNLIDLNIGLFERIDDNSTESFTIVHCDFYDIKSDSLQEAVENIFRTTDSIVNYKSDYFFILPYTDKIGANKVKKMIQEFYERNLDFCMVSYPKDGENSQTLLEELRVVASSKYKNDLRCLDSFITYGF